MNLWSVTALFSVFAVLVVLFFDIGKKILSIVMIVVLLAIGGWFLYMDSQGGDDSVENIIETTITR